MEMEVVNKSEGVKKYRLADITPGQVFYWGGQFFIKMAISASFCIRSSISDYDNEQFAYNIGANCLCIWDGETLIEDAPLPCKIVVG